MAKDPRTPEEIAAWEADKITAAEADAANKAQADLERQREAAERQAGNPLAPPE